MVHILARIGWPVVQLDGGYKEYRRHVNAELATLPAAFEFINVLCGPTGSGKSRLLQVLGGHGAHIMQSGRFFAFEGKLQFFYVIREIQRDLYRWLQKILGIVDIYIGF